MEVFQIWEGKVSPTPMPGTCMPSFFQSRNPAMFSTFIFSADLLNKWNPAFALFPHPTLKKNKKLWIVCNDISIAICMFKELQCQDLNSLASQPLHIFLMNYEQNKWHISNAQSKTSRETFVSNLLTDRMFGWQYWLFLRGCHGVSHLDGANDAKVAPWPW